MRMFNSYLFLALMLIFISSPVFSNEKLNEAYQREYIYLLNQKKNLNTAKEKTISQLNSDLKKLEGQVEFKLNQLSNLENQNLDLEQRLDGYKETIKLKENNSKKIESLIVQAQETLKSLGVSEDVFKTTKKPIEFVFSQASDSLKEIDSVKLVNTSIYNIKGEKTDSKVYKMGLVASLGSENKSSQVLAPAGMGQLKVVKNIDYINPTTIKSENGSLISLFIYDSLAKVFEPKLEKTMASILEAGGLIGYIIILFGLFALFVAYKRFRILKKSDFTDSEKEVLLRNLKNKQLSKTSNFGSSQSLLIFQNELLSLNPQSSEFESKMDLAILKIEKKVFSYGPVLLGIAAVAPLLGLLGTVTGMISTFDIITDVGTGNPKMLSGGISEALVTTQFGLIVAIPCLLVGNWLNSWSKKIMTEIYSIQDSFVSTKEN